MPACIENQRTVELEGHSWPFYEMIQDRRVFGNGALFREEVRRLSLFMGRTGLIVGGFDRSAFCSMILFITVQLKKFSYKNA